MSSAQNDGTNEEASSKFKPSNIENTILGNSEEKYFEVVVTLTPITFPKQPHHQQLFVMKSESQKHPN